MKRLVLLISVILIISTAQANVITLTNAGFETGNTSGWNVNPSGGTVTVVTSHDDTTGFGTGVTHWDPLEGNYFALLTPGGPENIAQLTQDFLANEGDTLQFAYFWDSGDLAPFNDRGRIEIWNNIPTQTLAEHSVLSDPADYWGTPWTIVNYTIPEDGYWTISFEVWNKADMEAPSYLGVDTITIPAPGAILLGGIGVALVGWMRRRRTL